VNEEDAHHHRNLPRREPLRHCRASHARRLRAGHGQHEHRARQDIHAAVNEALQAHGFRPAAGQPPDMLIAYHVRLRNESEIEGFRWQVQEYHYTEGTLIVALVDPESKRFLWRGAAEQLVDPSASGDKQAQDIRNAVQKMFANFPS
jgi:hypothetical protein